MKPSHLIALTATIVTCSAATASARPAADPPVSQAPEPPPVTAGSMAAHRQQISDAQWQRSNTQPAPVPLTDRTATHDRLPLTLVLIALTGLLIVAIAKPVLTYSQHRRHPTSTT